MSEELRERAVESAGSGRTDGLRNEDPGRYTKSSLIHRDRSAEMPFEILLREIRGPNVVQGTCLSAHARVKDQETIVLREIETLALCGIRGHDRVAKQLH